MSTPLASLRSALESRGHRVIDLSGDGLGIEFRDGCDVWWVLPGDPLSSVALESGSAVGVEPVIGEFEQLDVLRSQAIHAIRHHLAWRRFRVNRSGDGQWVIETETCGASSSVQVGASLTAVLEESGNIIEGVRAVFTSSIVRQPSTRRVNRYLATVGIPAGEMPLRDDDAGTCMPTNPMAILSLMGICQALEFYTNAAEEGRRLTPEEIRESARPKGRIGQALVRFAAALPDASASFVIGQNALDVEFSDKLDSFRIRPKARSLAEQVSQHGPETAGDRLLAEYWRLNCERARVIAALRLGLPKLGYRVLDECKSLHFGRTAREGRVDLGQALTEALRTGSTEDVVRSVLAAHPALAQGVIAALPADFPAALPDPTKDLLVPPRPGPVELPPIAERDLEVLDLRTRSILSAWFDDRDILKAYFDPLLHDPVTDTWASRNDWLNAAKRFPAGEYPAARGELIRLELGDTTGKAAWLDWLCRVGWHGENEHAEIVGVYRYRQEMPDVARAWLAPKPFEDCPGAESRARAGDPIASRYLAASLDPDLDLAGTTLWRITPRALAILVEPAQIRRWREQAAQDVAASWEWPFVDEDLLKTAVVHGWREVAEAMARNDYLVHAVLHDEKTLFYGAGSMLVAWSRLAPSVWLAELIVALLGQDLRNKAEAPARRILGAMAETHPHMFSGIVDHWTTDLQRHLAVAWTRCRPLLD